MINIDATSTSGIKVTIDRKIERECVCLIYYLSREPDIDIHGIARVRMELMQCRRTFPEV